MSDVIRPEGWPVPRGYSDGMLSRDGHLFISGQVGWTTAQVFEARDFVGQFEQALKNVLGVVEAAGGTATDLVRLTWYIINKREYLEQQREVGQAYRRVMGRHFPTMSVVVVAGLIEDAALIEIEGHAVLSNPT